MAEHDPHEPELLGLSALIGSPQAKRELLKRIHELDAWGPLSPGRDLQRASESDTDIVTPTKDSAV